MYLPGPTTRQAQLGDELGFSFNPRKIISNVGKAVGKAVKDVGAEAGRAAKNPLVQTVASVVPGGGLVTKGIALVNRVQSSDAVQRVNKVRSLVQRRASPQEIADAGAEAVTSLRTGGLARPIGAAPAGGVRRMTPDALARTGRGAQSATARAAAEKRAADEKAAADKKAAADRRAEAARRKAAEGRATQERNRIEAERVAAEAKAAADRTRAERAERRTAKAAEGAAIQARNAEQAEADRKANADKLAETKKKLREATRAARKLEQEATARAASGDAAGAAQLREQAASVAQAARTVSVSSGASDAMPAAGPVYGGPVMNGPVPGSDTSSRTPLYIGAGVLAAGLLAVMAGGGASQRWR